MTMETPIYGPTGFLVTISANSVSDKVRHVVLYTYAWSGMGHPESAMVDIIMFPIGQNLGGSIPLYTFVHHIF